MKRRLAIAVLLFAALWPFPHRALVAALDLNPWKFGGWAMYTTPTPPLLVAVFTKRGERFALVPEDSLPPHVLELLDVFRRERHALGKLRRPDDFARATLRSRADLSSVVVTVQKMTLDRRTALMTSARELYDYDRAASLR